MSDESTQFNPIDPDAEGVSALEREVLVPDLLARRFAGDSRSYWRIVWDDFRTRKPALIALWVMGVMATIAVFAPLLANHRPYLLVVPEEIAASYAAIEPGIQFPVLKTLSQIDWILLFGLLQTIVFWTVFNRGRKRNQGPGPIASTGLLIFGVLPVATALLFSPAIHAEYGTPSDLISDPWWANALRLMTLLLGAFLFVRSLLRLYSRTRDVLGNLNSGWHIFGALAGSILLLVTAARVGTGGQRELDVTDYVQVAEAPGVTAIFPPVQQDYLASNSYIRQQSPLGPYLRVQPSGGSSAASDLGLSDNRREANLAWENGFEANAGNPRPITRETPLTDLRSGNGARMHSDLVKDFTIVSHSLDRYSVTLNGALTVGDVIDRINASTGGAVVASIRRGGTGIDFDDRTTSRPTYLMGTDSTGSDVASRLIHATRVALSIGFVSTSIALLIGITAGALMGYFGGWVDIVGMRIIEIFMAVPRLFLLLTVIAFIPPKWNEYMLYAMMAVIGAFSWMNSARFIRAEFFRLRDQDFIHAAQACGLPLRSVLFKHMLPNGVTPVLVDASFGVAAAIFVETGLSFLGFGIKPPDPSWGQMLAEAVDPSSGVFFWWMAIFPGIMIFLTVFAFNLIGDALRDAIDPKLKKAAQ